MKYIQSYDLIIIGAGLVGSSLAAALAKENIRVAILDKAKAPVNSTLNFNSRAIALSWNSIQLLKKIGVWAASSQAINEVHISEQGHFGVTRIKALDMGQAYLGSVLNADTLNWGINEFLVKNIVDTNLTIFRQTEIETLEKKNGVWELALGNGECIQGSLLVGADGTDSFVRKHQGIDLKLEPQLHTAMMANIKLAQSHGGIAYERFLKQGSVAILPFGDNWVKCVWIVSNEEAEDINNKNDEVFLQDLQKVFGFQLGYFQEMGKRFAYPIQASAAENIYGLGWVLIGNAANTLSPVAAQGFNLGLRDACVLAEALIDALGIGSDCLQKIDFLRQYAAVRADDHRRIKQFTQQLETGGVKRRLGIIACELFDPLKQKIGHLGMGIHPL